MKSSLLDLLITSRTRIKLLLRFFLNPQARNYLRSIAEEFGESTNSVRVELNRLTKAGLLTTSKEGRTIYYQANQNSPLFADLHKLIKKYIGLDVVERIINRLGNVKYAFITGDYARGLDSGVIDLVVVGDIDKNYLNELIEITEKNIKRKIRPLVLNMEDYKKYKENLKLDKAVIIWNDNRQNNRTDIE